MKINWEILNRAMEKRAAIRRHSLICKMAALQNHYRERMRKEASMQKQAAGLQQLIRAANSLAKQGKPIPKPLQARIVEAKKESDKGLVAFYAANPNVVTESLRLRDIPGSEPVAGRLSLQALENLGYKSRVMPDPIIKRIKELSKMEGVNTPNMQGKNYSKKRGKLLDDEAGHYAEDSRTITINPDNLKDDAIDHYVDHEFGHYVADMSRPFERHPSSDLWDDLKETFADDYSQQVYRYANADLLTDFVENIAKRRQWSNSYSGVKNNTPSNPDTDFITPEGMTPGQSVTRMFNLKEITKRIKDKLNLDTD